MTPNQYIITEEELCGFVFSDGAPRDKEKIYETIRSRPYQRERDTVLDELEKWCRLNTFHYQLFSSQISELRQKAGE
jgi:hypothetical protein